MSTFINIIAANSNCSVPIAVAIIGCSRRRGICPGGRITRRPRGAHRATHRDPAAVLPSLCSLCEILRGAASDAVDKPAIGAHWHARLKAIFEQANAVRATAAEGQILDIQYADLVADPIATVQHIYAHHGYEFTETFESAMRQWLAANRQHKHGAHRYTLAEYGLSEAQVHEIQRIYEGVRVVK